MRICSSAAPLPTFERVPEKELERIVGRRTYRGDRVRVALRGDCSAGDERTLALDVVSRVLSQICGFKHECAFYAGQRPSSTISSHEYAF